MFPLPHEPATTTVLLVLSAATAFMPDFYGRTTQSLKVLCHIYNRQKKTPGGEPPGAEVNAEDRRVDFPGSDGPQIEWAPLPNSG